MSSSKLVHLDGKNLACFTWNLVANLMILLLISENKQEAAIKCFKVKKSRKIWIYVFRSIIIKRQVRFPGGALKEFSFVILCFFFSAPVTKRSSIKAFSEVSSVSLTLRSHANFLKFFKKCREFPYTVFLRSSKPVKLNWRKSACYTWNLVQNLLSLVLISKTNMKYPESV